MNSFELLRVLINELESYEEKAEDKNDLSIEEFIASISPEANLDHLKNNFVNRATTRPEEVGHQIENNIERVIAQHLLFMYRYIKLYSKMVFAEGEIKTIEDFGFLVTMMQVEALPKSELIRRNIFEKSSGIEIINRLVKFGLLAQKDNPHDGRSQLVMLTDRGRASLYQVFHKMNDLGVLASGNLTKGEKMELAVLLKKLDNFHFENYHGTRSDNLSDYMPES